jgi:hypothetical protein
MINQYHLYRRTSQGGKTYVAADSLDRALTGVKLYAKPYNAEEAIRLACDSEYYIESAPSSITRARIWSEDEMKEINSQEEGVS